MTSKMYSAFVFASDASRCGFRIPYLRKSFLEKELPQYPHFTGDRIVFRLIAAGIYSAAVDAVLGAVTVDAFTRFR